MPIGNTSNQHCYLFAPTRRLTVSRYEKTSGRVAIFQCHKIRAQFLPIFSCIHAIFKNQLWRFYDELEENNVNTSFQRNLERIKFSIKQATGPFRRSSSQPCGATRPLCSLVCHSLTQFVPLVFESSINQSERVARASNRHYTQKVSAKSENRLFA